MKQTEERTMVVFVCEDSPEGIFTGVYDAWNSRLGHENGWKYRANIITACFRSIER